MTANRLSDIAGPGKVHARWITVALLGLMLLGCGQNRSGRVGFSGHVTRDGKRVPHGFVSFRPTDGHMGPAANADILEGEYHFTGSDGPLPGPHVVTISVATLGSKAAGRAPAVEPSRWEFEISVRDAPDFTADFSLAAP